MSSDLESNLHQNNLNGVNHSGSIVYGFEDYRLDAEHLMLYRSGREVSLTPKQTETLLALIEQRGEIVSKDALMQRLWGNSAVEESNLIQNIYVLRKTLGFTRDGQPMIETLRRRGYRFNAELTDHKHRKPEVSAAMRLASIEAMLDPPGALPPTDGAGKETVHFSSRKKIVGAIVSASLLAALSVVVYFALVSKPSGPINKKLAILPLTAMDPTNRNILFEIGIADSLINRLNSTQGLTIRPLSSVRKYAQAEPDPVAAGVEQKVDYVLASSYQIAEGQIKVTANLMNVSTGEVEESFNASADSASMFAAQDAVANIIGHKLRAKFGPDASEFQTKRGTENEEAYRSYSLAMNLSEERGVQNVTRSLEYLEKAVALDPNYALAWAAKALAHNDMVGHGNTDPHKHYRLSMEALTKALAIDPNVSEAYSALCWNKNRYEYDPAGAEEACKRAVEVDPRSAVAHKTYANFLYTRGRFDEAIAEVRTSMDLQPVSYRNHQIYALTLYFARRFGEAEAQFKRLIELNPNQSGYIHGRLVFVLEMEGKYDEAFEHLINTLTIKKADEGEIERFKTAYRKQAWRGVLAEQIKTAEAEKEPGSYQLACLYTKIGNKDKAFEYLEKAYNERSFQIAILEVEPQLDPLRSDPRYAGLIARIYSK
jgi:DNA-binding winged helix-turn-helix (wHTH) protein/tetratricopeptide (TPR) repeat protein